MDSKEMQLLQLFEELVPAGEWNREKGGRGAAQIYGLAVAVELMLVQRLTRQGTQREAVASLREGHLRRVLPDSKRVREGRISAATGGYARACARVSPEQIGGVCDRVLEDLAQRIEPEAGRQRPVLLLDGTSLQVGAEPELREAFPAGHNQHGRGHWGIVRRVGLHDVRTGIALRPEWGPMYGTGAVSEQALAERLPGRALPVCWRMSAQERKKHPELPAEAAVAGRLLVVAPKGFRPLYLFTTLEGEAEELAALYARRWEMELDLRALKRSMHLHHVYGKSRAAVEKEILTAVIGYGLVRACMAAAGRAGLPPRRLSFTGCCGLLNRMIDRLCTGSRRRREAAFDLLLERMAQSRLPNRSKPRTYPRAVWGSGATFPKRHEPPSAL